MKQTSHTKNILLFILMGSIFFLGFAIGNRDKVFADEYWNLPEGATISQEDFNLFWKALSILDTKHPDAASISSEEKVWAAIQGLAQSYGDPYTSFFNPEEMEIFEEDITGEFSGVGMEVGMEEDFITVIAPLKNSPAEQAGIQTGDIITAINGQSAFELTLDEAVQKIRGPRGESVTLTIAREGEENLLEFTIVRDIIEIVALETQEKGDIYIISLYNFTETIGEEFENAVQDFVASGKKKLVLDLRGNPGGYLSSSIDIASIFIPQGKTIVTESFSPESGREDIVYRSKGSQIRFPKDIKMVVLIDAGSASASEIVAGALREYNIATLVGTKTFGKGSVQEYLRLDDETSLKVTVAKWLTPLGNSIDEAGLTPDHEVAYDPSIEEDNQLQKAIEILNQK